MTTQPTLENCLRLAEALSGETAEYPIIRELKAALTELVTITAAKESQQ